MAYVTTGEAAAVLGVGLNTVKRWIASGDLQGIRTPGGHWRIPEMALEHFMQTQGMQMPAEDENPARILIVDDEPHVCTLLRGILEDAAFPSDIKCAHDGYTGLIQIGSWRPDVLLLDVFMPGIDGIEVLHRLQADHELAGDMKIIVVTAAFDRPILKQAL
ncbi:MAG: response regulator, partial [Mariprofundus sp.]|nr:response regulator [Mariprofundus sp.]